MKKLFIFTLFLAQLLRAEEYKDESFEHVQMQDSPKSYQKNTQTKKTNPCPYPYSYESPLPQGCVYTEGEWLYYKPEAQIPFADVITIRRYVSETGTVRLFADDDKEVDNTFNYDSGYRVKLGVNLPYSGWDTSFQYQQLKSSTQESVEIGTVSAPNGFSDTKLLFPYWVSAGMGVGANYKWNAAWSTQSLNYRIFDWGLDKTFYVKNHFALTPFIGVRASWIKTDLNVTYRGAGGDSSALSNIQDQVHMQNNFYAWGIRAGLKANWLLGAGFELFGKSFLSALTGSHLFRLNEDFIDAPSGTEDVHAASHREKTWNSTLPCLELSGGINWGTRFYKDKLYIGFRFGYDYQLWFNLIRLNRYRYANLPQNIPSTAYVTSIFSVFKNNLVLRGYSLGGSLHF